MRVKRIFLILFLAGLFSCLFSCRGKEASFSTCEDGHDLCEHPLVEATCEVDGTAAYLECSRCHKLFDESGNRVSLAEITLPAACQPDGFWWFDETEHEQTCLVCGKPVLTGKHRFEDGVCTVCGAEREEAISCQHEGGTATCLTQAICSICGQAYGRLAAHEKVKISSEAFLASEATCTKRASYYASCAVCGFVFAETFTVGEPLGHTGATCKSSAPCTRCGVIYGPTNQHDFSGMIPTEAQLAVPATCISQATYYKTCIGCGKIGSETFSSGAIDPENHRFEVDPSGTDENAHTLVCTRCKAVLIGAHIPDQPGSCQDLVHCRICGESCYAAAHDFSLANVAEEFLATPATCQSQATYFCICANCSAIGGEPFPYGPLGEHHYENGVCAICGAEE